MIPLVLPMQAGLCVPPEMIDDEPFGSKARASLESKERKQQQSVRQKPSRPPQPLSRSAVVPPSHRRKSLAAPVHNPYATANSYRVEDYPSIDWGSDVRAVDISETDFVQGMTVTPVLDRKLVKLGFLAARAVMCLQHPDVVVPEVLLADFAAAGSGSVLLCDERSRFSLLGVQLDISSHQRKKALEVLSLEFNLDLSSYTSQVPAPCTLYAVDAWDTIAVRSAITQPTPVSKGGASSAAKDSMPPASAVSSSPALPPTSSSQPNSVTTLSLPTFEHPSQQPAVSLIDTMLKKGRIEPLQLLRKLLNTSEDPEAPLEKFFPNKKQLPQRYVTLVTNTVHFLPPMYPIGIRHFDDFLVHRFRPEFVRDYGGLPLLSTACYASCPVGALNEHKQRLFRATLHLYNVTVPTCAASLNVESQPLHGEDLCNRLHMFGVNVRFLGWLLPWISSSAQRKAIVTEIAARSYKRVEERRDRERHNRLVEVLQAMSDKPSAPKSTGGRPPLPTVASVGAEDKDSEMAQREKMATVSDEDEEAQVEFSELTRIAVNAFYPPHLWVPLPKFLRSEMLLLERMHPKYGVVLDVLETWEMAHKEEAASDDDVEGTVHAAADAVAVGNTELPFSVSYGEADTRAEKSGAAPLVIDGIDFGLELDTRSCPPTPHVEQAYEFDTILHPSAIDSEQVEGRILDLVRRQRFVFLPGRFPVLSREYHLNLCSSAALQVYFDYVQQALSDRKEACAHQLQAGRNKKKPNMTLKASEYSAGCLPLLRGLGQLGAVLYPFEGSASSPQSAVMYFGAAVEMLRPFIAQRRTDEAGGTAGNAGLSKPTGEAVVDPLYWFGAAIHLLSLFYAGSDNVAMCVAVSNEGLQFVVNPRIRLQLLQTQMNAHIAKALRDASERSILSSNRSCKAPMQSLVSPKRLGFNFSTTHAPDTEQSFPSIRSRLSPKSISAPVVFTKQTVMAESATPPPPSTEILSASGSSPTSGRQSFNELDSSVDSSVELDEAIQNQEATSSTSSLVLPLMVDILRTLPLAVPPRHPVRSQMYLTMLRTLEAIVDPDMLTHTAALLSPRGSEASMAKGQQSTTNVSQAEGTAKEELLLMIPERNFAGCGAPFETLVHLKRQRDAFLERCTPCPHFVSPSALRFSYDEGKFPDFSDSPRHAVVHQSTPSAYSDVMSVLDAFLSTDREGMQQLEDDNMVVFVCETGKTAIVWEAARNILEMRKMNAHSIAKVVPISEVGDTGTQPSSASSRPFTAESLLEDSTMGNQSASTTVTTVSTVRQQSNHAKLWSVDRKQNTGTLMVPLLPLCSLLPILIDCRSCAPYDEDFLTRALPSISDSHLRLLSVNPKLILFFDGYDPSIPNTAGFDSYRNFLTWKCKKVVLIGSAVVSRMTPFDMRSHLFPSYRLRGVAAQNVRAVSFYSVLRWSERHIAKALQVQGTSCWDQLSGAQKYPIIARRNAQAFITPRWHLLKHICPSLLSLMEDPKICTMIGYSTPLLVPFAATCNRRLTSTDVLDCVLFSQYVIRETVPATQSDAIMYAITLATLMTQTHATVVKYEAHCERFLHCLPIRVSDEKETITFVHPIFVPYFLSVRCVLELLESEEQISKCFKNPFGSDIFTSTLAALMKRNGLRRSKSILAAQTVRDLMVKNKSQGTLLKAVAKFADSRKRKLNGGEWLCRVELTPESDGPLIDLLADRCWSVPAFLRSLTIFGMNRSSNATPESRLIVPNALTIFAKARMSLSGRCLRGLDLTAATLDGICAVAADVRSTKWNFVVARDANFSFADFTNADFRSLDIGSEPTLTLTHRTASVVAVAFSTAENDVFFTGDDAGHLTRWRLDAGVAEAKVTVSSPIGRLALNPSCSLLVVCRSTSDTTMDVREVSKLSIVATLRGGHTARITGVAFYSDAHIISSGFDWIILLWELPTHLIPTALKIDPSADDAEDAIPAADQQPSALSQMEGAQKGGEVPKQLGVSPKRHRFLAPIQTFEAGDRSSSSPRRMLPAEVLASTKVWSAPPRVRQLMPVDEPRKYAAASERPHRKERVVIPAVAPARMARKHHVHITALDANAPTKLYAFLGGDGNGFIRSVEFGVDKETRFSFEDVKGAPCITFSNDGTKLAVPTNRGVAVLDTATGVCLLALTLPSNASCIPQTIAMSDDGTLLAAARDRQVCIWDAVGGCVLSQTRLFFGTDNKEDVGATSTPASAQTAGGVCAASVVAAVAFTRRGKSLLTSYWGGGLKATPILFSSDRRALQLQSDASGGASKSFTQEHRWLLLGNLGLHVIGVSFSGTIEVLDADTGVSLGSCGHVSDEPVHAVADLSSDLIAVLTAQTIHLFSIFKRIPPKTMPTLTRVVSCVAFAPPTETSLSTKTKFLFTCGMDRSIRVWECETGSLALMIQNDLGSAFLVSGATKMLWVSGFVSSRALTLGSMTLTVFPQPSKKKLGATGRVYLTPEGDMILSLQRLLIQCAKRRYGSLTHFADVGLLVIQSVLPYLRRQVVLEKTSLNSVVRLPSRDSVVRVAVGGPRDSVAAITYDTYVSLWNLEKDEQIRTQEAHSQPITSVDVSPDTSSWSMNSEASPAREQVLVATSGADGAVMITETQTGQRLVCIRPNRMKAAWSAKFGRRGLRGVSGPTDLDEPRAMHHVYASGSDGIVRKWSLAGAPCCIGSLHPVASLSAPQLCQWLESHNLASLTRLLADKLGADLMDMAPDAIAAMLMPLLPAVAPKGKLRRLSSVTGMSRVASSTALITSPHKRQSQEEALRIGGAADNAVAATSHDVERLRTLLRRVREDSYETLHAPSIDDAELTAEQFDSFTFQQLTLFYDFYTSNPPLRPALAAAPPILRESKIGGARLRSCKNSNELRSALLGDTTFEDLAKLLFHEVANIRNSRIKESFLEKSAADVAMFSRAKVPLVEFCFTVLNLGGRELLDRLNFSNQMQILCSDCGRKILDPRATCPVRRGNHTHLVPQLDPDSAAGMTRMVGLIRDGVHHLTDAMLELAHQLPEKTKFSCGVWWHPMIHDPGLVGVLQFSVPELTRNRTTLVNTATLNITSTDRNPPRMVAVVEEHPKMLQKLAGVAASVGNPALMSRLGHQLPPGWKRIGDGFAGNAASPSSQPSPSRHDSGLGTASSFRLTSSLSNSVSASGGGAVKYTFHESHTQSTHPTMPVSAASFNPEESLATSVINERLTSALAASMPALKPPKPHHRFRKPAAPDDATLDRHPPLISLLGEHLAPESSSVVTADVKDIVQAAAARGETMIRILVVAESIVEAPRELSAPACRPVLTVNYYDENKLCVCKTQCEWFPPKSAPVRQGGALVVPPPTTMGDGHLPPPSNSATTAAPVSNSSFSLFSMKQQQAAQQQPMDYFSGTLMCDRFCNINTQCRGHKCPSQSAACRRAPYLLWETTQHAGGLFFKSTLNDVANISTANTAHVQLHSKAPRPVDEGRRLRNELQQVLGSTPGHAVVSPTPATLDAHSPDEPPKASASTPLPPTPLPSLSGPGGTARQPTPLDDTAQASSGRRKTVTITSFEDVLQARGMS